MVETPWGNAAELRGKKLRPGPGMASAEVARSQRERLYAAMVAATETKGYEATTVTDLLRLSGVSRATFYKHFRDKEECFVATFEAIIAEAGAIVEREYAAREPWEVRARRALEGMLAMIAAQPAAARLCFADVYAGGPAATKAMEQASAGFAALVQKALGRVPGREGLPVEIARGLIGGARAVIHDHVHRGREQHLPALGPDLWEWGLSYPPPPRPLRLAGQRRRPERVGDPPFAAYSPGERIIRSLAAAATERGYPAVTIAEIAARASVSQKTFYANFESKEAALLGALDSLGAQMLAAVLPTARRAPDWPNSVRAAMGALCDFGAAEPALTRLAAVEVYVAGPRALEQRDRVVEQLRILFGPGYRLAPQTKPLVAEAIIGAVYELIHAQVLAGGPESLPEIAPLATYMALAPFLGAEAACEVANGDGLGRAVLQPMVAKTTEETGEGSREGERQLHGSDPPTHKRGNGEHGRDRAGREAEDENPGGEGEQLG